MTERSVFIAALDIQDSGERSAYLDEVCKGNARLRERVSALLRAHGDAEGFLDRPATEHALIDIALTATDSNTSHSPVPAAHTVSQEAIESDLDPGGMCGSRLGRYELLQKIGDGGFGVVYLAEQVEPVRRKVAVKIIKPGMDTREVIARFDAERQALALMDHPCIARVLDAGTTSHSGLPYFVMELVTGAPITEYSDLNQLTTRERLQLFASVCRAVQHAHQKGIIHRDLKPSNILVTLQDNRPIPKVIDFGVAKALNDELAGRTLYTACGQLIGTPAYMSPEQANLGGIDVDTRSDIYSLGALLYELLTGRTPLDSERLRGSKYDDLLRIIRDEEPPRPSLRLVAMIDTEQELIARQRATDPQRLLCDVAGDLDWIAMKALEKDRARRFETAAALARDVERFLQGEAVDARPPSQLYLFQKFIRRHKRKFSLAASLVVLSALTIIGLSISNLRIRAEQRETASQRNRAERALELADARANENAELLERLQTASALVGQARVFKEWLHWDEAERTLNRAIELLPEFAAARTERGNLYAQLGLWELAATDLRVAVAVQALTTSTDWLSYAVLCQYIGDADGYDYACTRMHQLFAGTNRRVFAMDIVRACTIGSHTHGNPQQLVTLAEAMVNADPRPEFLFILGVAHFRAGQYESAVERLRAAATTDSGWNSRAITGPVLAMSLQALGRTDEARVAFREALDAFDNWTRERYGSLHELWVIFDGGTANWPVPWQDWLQCRLQLQEAQQLLGLPAISADPRWHVLRGRAFAGLRRFDAAIAEFDRALEVWHDDLQLRAQSYYIRGKFHAERGEWTDAAKEFAHASELLPLEPYLLHFQAVSHLAAGELDAYQQACAQMVERFSATRDLRTAHSVVELCTLTPNAIPDATRLIPLAHLASDWYPGASRFQGAVRFRCGQYQEAVALLQAADELHSATAGDLFFLCMAEYRLGNIDESRRALASALEWIDLANLENSDDLRGTRPDWGRWDEQVVFPILRREAESLLAAGESESSE